MSDISSIPATDSLARAVIASADSPRREPVAGRLAHADRARAPDSVELSDAAVFLARLRELPSVRQDVVDRAKANLAAGVYDNPEIISAAADRLAADIDLRA